MGDPAGIGPEVTAKALESKTVGKNTRYVVIGNVDVFKKYGRSKVNVEFVHVPSAKPFQPGKPSPLSGQASLTYLDRAIEMIRRKKISALVTAPLSKEWVHFSEPGFIGHTEYLAHAFHVKQFEMMFVAGRFKVVLLTRHIPLRDVSGYIKKKNISQTLHLTHAYLKKIFRIKKPKIAVCGLNPHAGEGGLLGKEDILEIVPAIQESRKRGIIVFGPFSADTLFTPTNIKRFDCFIAMYHDQGLIPIKSFYLSQLVNLTIGLPFVRTSVAHGTAFDIAGKGKADPSSMIASIQLAQQLL